MAILGAGGMPGKGGPIVEPERLYMSILEPIRKLKHPGFRVVGSYTYGICGYSMLFKMICDRICLCVMSISWLFGDSRVELGYGE